MASLSQHIHQWKHNRNLLAVIPLAYPDWLVTVAFYVALHAVDSLLAHDKIGITRHDARNEVLIRTNRYSKIKESYLPLYDLSRTVRYLANPSKWVPPDQIDSRVLKRYLYPIEQSAQKLIAQDLSLSPIILVAATVSLPSPSTRTSASGTPNA